MGQNQLTNTRTFRRTLTAADGTGVVEILNCADCFAEYADLGVSYYLGKSFYLEALSGAVYLPSYQQALFAEIFPEMNAAERIAALLEIEEKYPFVGLRFHAKKGAGAWTTLATARLQNKGREVSTPFVVPYLAINNLKLLGPDDRLGVSIINYGHGVLGSGDYIQFEGDYRFTVDLIAKPQIRTIGPAVPYKVDIDTQSAFRFANSNVNRAILYATNIGDTPVWIGDSSITVGSGIYLAPNGNGSLAEEKITGELWAVAEGGSLQICGIEASYV